MNCGNRNEEIFPQLKLSPEGSLIIRLREEDKTSNYTTTLLGEEDKALNGVELLFNRENHIVAVTFTRFNVFLGKPSIRYLSERNMVYIRLRKRKPEFSIEISSLDDELMFDFDNKDRLFGIALLNPQKYFPKSFIQQFTIVWTLIPIPSGLKESPYIILKDSTESQTFTNINVSQNLPEKDISLSEELLNEDSPTENESIHKNDKKKKRGHTFYWKSNPEAQSVLLYGQFSSWKIGHKLKRRQDGTWDNNFSFYPGVWEYRFKVDGQWMYDPDQPTAESDDNINNVVNIKPNTWRTREAKVLYKSRIRKIKRSPFLLSICFENLETIQNIYSQNPSVLNDFDLQGSNAILLAAANGKLNLLKWLHEDLGLSLYSSRKDLSTPLMLSALHNHFPIVEYLWNQHLNTLIGTLQSDPEHNTKSSEEIIRIATHQAYDWINQVDVNGENVIFHSASTGDVKILEWLIERGAEVNKIGRCNTTAAHRAVIGGHLEALELLHRHGAPLQIKTFRRKTVWSYAIKNRDMNILKWLSLISRENEALKKELDFLLLDETVEDWVHDFVKENII